MQLEQQSNYRLHAIYLPPIGRNSFKAPTELVYKPGTEGFIAEWVVNSAKMVLLRR